MSIAVICALALSAASEPTTEAGREEGMRTPAANAGELLGLFGVDSKAFSLGAYAEVFYQWNFNRPANGITAFRGFDNRHNTFTVSNVALDAAWDWKDIVGRLTLQVGHTPNTYYLSEPSEAPAGGVSGTGPSLWKFIQQAYVGYRIPVGRGLLLQAGIFLSPIGPEGMAVRDNWNWSRSNLFFGLPFYHTGIRLSYELSSRWTLTLAGYNGWNSVVDGNDEKSLSAHATYTIKDTLALSFLYFSGVERPRFAPEGRAWRHLFDAHATWQAHCRVQVMMHASGGFEPNAFGVSAWGGGALYGRFELHRVLSFALRQDLLYEHRAQNTIGSAASIFFPSTWVASSTATLEVKPVSRVSLRVEFRHDEAAAPIYFRMSGLATRQDTLTGGITTWF
jgi:Putative beta-barrel porin-2, OmpL-like. bbp2